MDGQMEMHNMTFGQRKHDILKQKTNLSPLLIICGIAVTQ